MIKIRRTDLSLEKKTKIYNESSPIFNTKLVVKHHLPILFCEESNNSYHASPMT
jgi:hypothetical protein